jgi:hypothetical protein
VVPSRGAVVALDRLCGEAQIEALDQPGDAVWVHLELVAGAEVGQAVGLGLRDSSELDELGGIVRSRPAR